MICRFASPSESEPPGPSSDGQTQSDTLGEVGMALVLLGLLLAYALS